MSLHCRKCKHKSILVARQWQIVSFYPLLYSSALCTNYEICMFKGETEYHSKLQKKKKNKAEHFFLSFFWRWAFFVSTNSDRSGRNQRGKRGWNEWKRLKVKTGYEKVKHILVHKYISLFFVLLLDVIS